MKHQEILLEIFNEFHKCTLQWYVIIHGLVNSHFPFPNPIPQASDDLPLGATVPSLGLSNKAIFKTAGTEGGAADGDQTTRAGTAGKNAFGDNVPVFTSINLDSKLVQKKIMRLVLSEFDHHTMA